MPLLPAAAAAHMLAAAAAAAPAWAAGWGGRQSLIRLRSVTPAVLGGDSMLLGPRGLAASGFLVMGTPQKPALWEVNGVPACRAAPQLLSVSEQHHSY